LVTGEDTNNRYSVAFAEMSEGHRSVPHRHHFEEGFFVLAGQVTFTAGNQTHVLNAGDFINVSAGTAHYFKTQVEADILVVVGHAGLDRFEVGRPIFLVVGLVADIERMTAESLFYHIEQDPPHAAFEQTPDITLTRKGEGPGLAVVGDIYRFLATGADTHDRYSIWEAMVGPGGGPPLHVHSREDEGFYVLEGEMTFRVDDKTIRATAGTFVNLPPGVRHAFKNESATVARMLLLVAPAGLEQMFFETAVPVTDFSAPPKPTPDEIERLLTAAPRYGVEIFPPGGD
jgi:quercetin dioxygenase-like cupin family protein